MDFLRVTFMRSLCFGTKPTWVAPNTLMLVLLLCSPFSHRVTSVAFWELLLTRAEVS